MRVQTFYRCALWLPLLLPALTAFIVHGAGDIPATEPAHTLVELLLYSGIYGGLPYLVLAVFGTWWIDDRPEARIRRQALLAPLWMVAIWIPTAAIPAALARELDMFIGLVGLGTAVILALGYAYVALVFLMRRVLYSRMHDSAVPAQ